MMTLEEIRFAKINPAVAREAYVHADRRLSDALEMKKSFEQKAITLFGAYITASIALFGTGGAASKDTYWNYLSMPLFAAALMFIAGLCFFVLALMDKVYGSPASDPDMWLNTGTIDGDDSTVPLMLAYITFYHKERIRVSIEENDAKAINVRCGIFLGLFAPLVMFLVMIWKIYLYPLLL